jgi:organic hydroperoxide reductase OsmC/OhrA
MTTMTVQLRSIPGIQGAVGWADGHTIVVDRPEGRAGGMGLGFNGGQLLGLGIGGCFCNDLQYVAHDMGVSMATIAVDVTVTLEGSPLLATQATMRVAVKPQRKPRTWRASCDVHGKSRRSPILLSGASPSTSLRIARTQPQPAHRFWHIVRRKYRGV